MSGPTAETIGRALAWRYRKAMSAVRRLAAPRDPRESIVVLAHPAAVVEGRELATDQASAAFIDAHRELGRHLWETAEPVEHGRYLFMLDDLGFVRVGRVES